jgi:2,4-dienoyl-CoA reductase (NADPH2)
MRDRFECAGEPLEINGLVVPNRIVFPAIMTGYSNSDGTVSDRELKFYEAIARSRVGLVIVGATAIEPAGVGFMGNSRIDSDTYVEGLERLFHLIKAQGCVAGIQLYHAGCRTNSARTGGRPIVAPSAIPPPEGGPTPRELTSDEIANLEEAFVRATERAVAAGADFIEYHAAHGVLINQFLSPLFNQRSDEYGGPLQNRARFALNILDGARRLLGTGPVLGFRINAVEFAERGLTLDESKELARMFVEHGSNYVDVSAWGNPRAIVKEMKKGTFVQMAAAIKEVVDVPVVCVGGIKHLEQAERILSDGAADLVAIGRGLIADPLLVAKILDRKEDEINECLDCWKCLGSVGDDQGKGMECPQNPDLP